jgi:arylsulfatase A-like enzyme/Tfp pilus assembly protein PilF
LKSIVVLVLALAACGRPGIPENRSLVLVTLDTTRADRIGAFGGTTVPTPNLDRLAREGTIALGASSQVPLTLPSHASILTGRYPASHGVHHNGIYRLLDDEETIAEHLAASGFDTAGFVASYVLNRGFGTEQGFDVYDDVEVNRYAGGRDQVFEAQRTADEVNARVDTWLAAHRDKRLFLWVHYYDPHEPYDPPEKPGRTLEGSGYDREISYVDACLGDLIETLRETGVLDRALLVIVGDHGEGLGEHGEKTHGLFLYEGTLHVPLLLRAPGIIPAGRTIGGPVELVDLAPTVADYLGLPSFSRAQGKSLRARIEGRDDGRAAQARAETMMPRLEFGWADLRMLRDGRFKYIRAPRPELYDLRADPAEERDLVNVESGRAADMAGELNAWVAATTEASAEAASHRALDPDEAARLRSLGYLAGAALKDGRNDGPLVDPKDGIVEAGALDAARDLLRAGDAAGALAALDPILAANPRNHQARVSRILALIELPDLRQAEDEAQRALAMSTSDGAVSSVLADKARGVLASVLRLQGKNREAEAEYRRILANDPANEAAAVDLARLLGETHRADEAARLLDGVLAKDARNGMALAARFQLETRRGDGAARLKTARALADARAGDPQTLIEIAELLADAGDPARAAVCYELVLDQASQPEANLLGQLGFARLRAGNLEGAQSAFEAVSKLRPSEARPVYFLGVIARRRGDDAAARAYFARTLALDPGFRRAAVALREIDATHP